MEKPLKANSRLEAMNYHLVAVLCNSSKMFEGMHFSFLLNSFYGFQIHLIQKAQATVRSHKLLSIF